MEKLLWIGDLGRRADTHCKRAYNSCLEGRGYVPSMQ